MTDDPRALLAEAGVECAELTAFLDWDSDGDSSGPFVHEMADPVILALARLVARYKWRDDVHASDEFDKWEPYHTWHEREKEDEMRARFISERESRLDRRWSERDASPDSHVSQTGNFPDSGNMAAK